MCQQKYVRSVEKKLILQQSLISLFASPREN